MALIVKRLLNINLNSLVPGTNKSFYAPFVPPLGRKLTSQFASYTTQAPPNKIEDTFENDKTDYLEVFPDVVRELTNFGEQSNITLDSQKWFAKVLQYNVSGGTLNWGMSVYQTLKEFSPNNDFTPEMKRKAFILGWIGEMFWSHYLVIDDIVDQSKLRKGKQCWYLNDDVGLRAVIDTTLLKAGAFKLLSNHFKNEEYYVDMIIMIEDMFFNLYIGQCMDLQTCHKDKNHCLDKFTFENYDVITRYKTSYAFYINIAMAMLMAGITDKELFAQAKSISFGIGKLFQIGNDYSSCFGDRSITGEDSCDIRDGKCTWLAVLALQRASNSQRKIMEENYGKDDDYCVRLIKDIYEELDIPASYLILEESTLSAIRNHIQQISSGSNQQVFFNFLEMMHKKNCFSL